MHLAPDTPTTVVVEPLPNGGVRATLRVPTYGGGATFSIAVERDVPIGDWRVYLPWTSGLSDEPVRLDDGHEVLNGVAYLGAPDETVEAAW